MEYGMTDKMIEVGTEAINKCDEYFNEFAKENGKKGFRNKRRNLNVYKNN